jgi:bifunctional UDP-N-acetylglucosamine pyrophosphorylase/glucosamine-1-phosphate N-acetyltransferase
MESGVTVVDSASTFIDEDVQIEPDTVIYPFTMISGPSRIGGSCTIGPSARILSSQIGERCRVESSTVEDSLVGDDVHIGPYAHLRAGALIGSGCEIGNYAEIKKSSLGPGTRMHHFSYVGDAELGTEVNVGAGTITCNFDGVAKHRTVIEDGAFIGSDTMLRAPVRVGEGAFTGVGSVVTRDVPARKLVIGVPARVVGDAPDLQSTELESEEREPGEA